MPYDGAIRYAIERCQLVFLHIFTVDILYFLPKNFNQTRHNLYTHQYLLIHHNLNQDRILAYGDHRHLKACSYYRIS